MARFRTTSTACGPLRGAAWPVERMRILHRLVWTDQTLGRQSPKMGGGGRENMTTLGLAELGVLDDMLCTRRFFMSLGRSLVPNGSGHGYSRPNPTCLRPIPAEISGDPLSKFSLICPTPSRPPKPPRQQLASRANPSSTRMTPSTFPSTLSEPLTCASAASLRPKSDAQSHAKLSVGHAEQDMVAGDPATGADPHGAPVVKMSPHRRYGAAPTHKGRGDMLRSTPAARARKY